MKAKTSNSKSAQEILSDVIEYLNDHLENLTEDLANGPSDFFDGKRVAIQDTLQFIEDIENGEY